MQHSTGGIFNNAAQVFNHNFYWLGLSGISTNPSIELSDLIKHCFGSMEAFKKEFLDKAAGLFGSGWVWLVLTKDGNLSIEELSNADNPMHYNRMPLLTCDIWEHAYYIDYRNVRPDYLENWWKVINWKFVSNNLTEAQK